MDTPGFGVDLREEELAIDNLVNFLQRDLKHVNAFVIAFKQSDIREMVYFRTMMKLVHSIFGEEFWDHVIIEATFWGYSREKMEDREAAGLTEENWLEGVPKKTIANIAGNIDRLSAVYIDTYYRPQDQHQRDKFLENTRTLFQFAVQSPAFHCTDISQVKDELRELEEVRRNLTNQKILIEKQKKDLEQSCDSDVRRLQQELAERNKQFYTLQSQRNQLEQEIIPRVALLFITVFSSTLGLILGCCCYRAALLCREPRSQNKQRETLGRRDSLSMKVCYPSEYEIDQEEDGGTVAGAEPGAVGWISFDVSKGRLHNWVIALAVVFLRKKNFWYLF